MQSYFVIDSVADDDAGRRIFRVWERSGSDRSARLLGEHRSLEAAKASVPVTWHDAVSDPLEAWAWGSPVAARGGAAPAAAITQARGRRGGSTPGALSNA